tara:strand:- start:219 stop:2171 length:1953 start_codon:yes stop_codon:yes gene_type:complete
MSNILAIAEEKFGSLHGQGEWTKAFCPACSPNKPGKARSLSINVETGYYVCHRDDCETWGYLDGNVENGKPQEPHFNKVKEPNVSMPINEKVLSRVNFGACKKYFHKKFDEIIQFEGLNGCWSNISLNEPLHIGYKENEGFVFGIPENGMLNHIKCHKGKQYGSAHNKIYPDYILKNGDRDATLFLCEGEKDVISMLCHGFQAITFTSGAKAIPKDISTLVTYKNVVICYDNDEPGKTGANKTAQKLKTTNPEMRVRIAEWDDVNHDGYDVTDMFRAGGNRDSVMRIAKNAYEFGTRSEDFGGMVEMNVSNFLDIQEVGGNYIMNEILIESGMTVLAGSDNVGKSILAMEMGVSMAMGVPFLAFEVAHPVKVLFAQFEMMNTVMQKRIRRSMNHYKELYPERMDLLEKNFIITPLSRDKIFSDKWEKIKGNMIAAKVPFDVVIIDNLMSSTHKNIIKNHELKDVLSQIRDVQNGYNVGVLLINHHNKLYGDSRILEKDMIRGGKLLTDYADNVIQVADSKRLEKLKVWKITKIRTESDFHQVHCGIRLQSAPDELWFKWIGPLEGAEEMWYEEPKYSLIDKIVIAMKDYANSEDCVSRTQITAIIEEKLGYTADSTITGWINKLIKFNKLEKVRHNSYKVVKSELDVLDL